MIRCVVFDFDGTLVLSNGIKHDAFGEVCAKFPGGRDLIGEILRQSNGDRSVIFQRFSEAVGRPSAASALIERYTQICETRILECPERRGASRALSLLRARGSRLHVNSSTPTDPLKRTIDKRYGTGAFDGVYGGYGCKGRNLIAIGRREGLEAGAMAMIGDGLDDAQAAQEFGCRFIGVAGGNLRAAGQPLVDDLSDIVKLLWH